MNNKKKILITVAVLALVIAATIGTTLAFFTDKKDATNTFTVGNVKIELVEKGVDKDGAAVAFNSDDAIKQLMPGGTPVVKEVTVKNIGSSDAYMWIEVKLAKKLDGELILNWAEGVTTSKTTVEADVVYRAYITADTAHANGESTGMLLKSVSLNPLVTRTGDQQTITLSDGKTEITEAELKVIVTAYGIQAAGMTDIADAIAKYNN